MSTDPQVAAPPRVYRASEIHDGVVRRVHGYFASLQDAFGYCEAEERKKPLVDSVRFELFATPGGKQWLIHEFFGPKDGMPETSDFVISQHEVIGSAAPTAPVAAPPTDRSALAEDLRYVLDYRGPGHAHDRPGIWDTSGKPCDHCARLGVARRNLAAYDADPDAVLPAPVDRTAVLREAADLIEARQDRLDAEERAKYDWLDHETVLQGAAVRDMAAYLREQADDPSRMAAETPGPGTQGVRHAPGTAILCPDCRAKGHSICMAEEEQQPETQAPAEIECANCWRVVENRSVPNMGGPSRDNWVHVPGGFTPCFPQRGADSPRAEPELTVVPQPEIVHACPPDGSGLTPCCGRTPFELPRTDRISSEAPVTCTGPAVVAEPGKENDRG